MSDQALPAHLRNHIPDHVPRERVRDIDLFNPPGGDVDIQAAWRHIQEQGPAIYFTPRYGGYWVVTRAELLEQIWGDHERFSSVGAIGIPRLPDFPPQLPIEAPPALHRAYREPVNFALSPRAVQQLTERARTLMIEVIERIRSRGECDFVTDVAAYVPMEVFLGIVDLPSADRDWLIERTQLMTRGKDVAKREQALTEVMGYLSRWIDERSAKPGDDLLSKIIQIKVDGKPIPRNEVLGESAQILFGGLDTVAGSMAFFAWHLARHPEHRRQLAADPTLIPKVIEELLRRYSMPTVGRHLTQDVTMDGVTMKAGDYVQLTTIFHAVDERQWPQAMDVQFDRKVAQFSMSFGRGIHKCPGSHLARSELRIFLEEWLRRIPEFSLKPGAQIKMGSGGVAGILNLPLVWPVAGPT